MVVAIRLEGGLGNQLFQYSAARQLAHMHGTDVVLDVASLSDPKRSTGMTQPRRFALQALRIKATTSCLWSEPLSTQLRIRLGAQLPAGLARRFGVFREPHFHFSRAFCALPSRIYLIGFFQSERYFHDIGSVIMEELRPRDERLLTDAETEILGLRRSGRPLVSVHVRRTDYLPLAASGHVHELGADYYGPAMAKFGPNADFLLFSDDPAWCRRHLCGDNIFQGSTGNDLADLLRMSLCDHHIIANSTFGWWGAWLDPKTSKTVVAPRRWFGPSSRNLATADLLPSDWITL